MLLASFTAYGVSQKYRHLRPEASTPMTDPKAWFKFAGNAVLSDIRERRRLWTWQFFKERKEDRESYVKIWKKNRTGIPLSVEESQALEDLQRKLSFDDLRLYRTYAIMQLRKEGRDAVRSQPEAPAPSSSYSWLSSWWGGSTAEESGPRINTSATEVSYLRPPNLS